MSLFGHIQDEIYTLLEDANNALTPGDALYYGGTYFTGCTHNPDFLFIGANPGHINWDSRQQPKPEAYTPTDCKFIDEYKNGLLAQRIVEVILHGDVGRLAACAETSAYSFFATPDVDTLDNQLKSLKAVGLFDRHAEMMRSALKNIIQETQPKNIVCIGVEVFDEVRMVCGDKSQPVFTEKPSNRRIYLESDLNGTPLIGILHLSGAQPSRAELNQISRHFYN